MRWQSGIVLASPLVVALIAPICLADHTSPQCRAFADGDVIIGILSSVHATVSNLQDRVRPDQFICTNFELISFVRMLAAIHTIDAINEANFLPGIRLGYSVYDPCADATKALHCVEHMLSINGSLPVMDNYTDFRPHVKIVLGERYSLLTIPVAKLLSVYLFPQISTTSSAVVLSDKLKFPGVVRVIPSDVHQTEALAQLVSHFGWNWVGLVSMDDDYGTGAHQSFLKNAEEAGVCVAFEEVVSHYLKHEENEKRIKEVARRIHLNTKVQVIALIFRPELVKMLFEEIIRLGTSRVWLASDAWSRSALVATMPGINKVGDILGLNFVTGHIPNFEQSLRTLTIKPGVRNDIVEEFKQTCIPDSAEECIHPDGDYLVNNVDLPAVYSERVAIWAIAHALRDLLECDDHSCSRDTDFPPYKLLETIKRVNFTLDEESKFFNQEGDFEDGYDVLMFEPQGNRRGFKTIGRYSVANRQVNIQGHDVMWTSTVNNTDPQSRCSPSCSPGTHKMVSNISCCYDCDICNAGTYTDSEDQEDCLACPNGTWSMPGWSSCKPRTIEFLRWSQGYPIALLVGVAIGILLLLFVFICFLVHRTSLVMKSSNVLMSCFMMLGLAVSFGSVVLYIGRPTLHLCRGQQTMYAMGFTLCVSCILVKAFRTFLAFMAFDPVQRDRLKKLYKPIVIMTLFTFGQGIVCIFWLVYDSPDVDPTPPSNQSMIHLLQCSEGSRISFAVMHGYIALLALVCFLLAFKGRKVPQDYNETGIIIFSMLIHLFVWLCFIPIYITKNESRPIVQASAILVSNYGIIFCHFVPKCYRAIFGKHTTERMRARLRNFSEIRNRASEDLEVFPDDPENDSSSHRSVTFDLPPFGSTRSMTDSGFLPSSSSRLSLRSASTTPVDSRQSVATPSSNESLTDPVFVITAPEGPSSPGRSGSEIRHRARSMSF